MWQCYRRQSAIMQALNNQGQRLGGLLAVEIAVMQQDHAPWMGGGEHAIDYSLHAWPRPVLRVHTPRHGGESYRGRLRHHRAVVIAKRWAPVRQAIRRSKRIVDRICGRGEFPCARRWS